jgi:iron complex outermembrane receptor protein
MSKSAKDTQGGLLTLGGGTQLQDFVGARYGGTLATNVYFRVYGKYFDRNSTEFSDGSSANNDWRMGQSGFRLDWLPANGDTFTLQGDGYANSLEQPARDNATANGQNILGRWTHVLGERSDFTLQLYWDRIDQDIPDVGAETLNTYDVVFQHRFAIGERNRVVWGGGYRLVSDDVTPTPVLSFDPPSRNLQLFSVFAQDEIALVQERLQLTLGGRLEHNDYSEFEFQPNVRLAWTPNDSHTVWGAVSRAVRSPSRVDRDIVLTVPPVTILGSENSLSEKLIAYELGYRIQPVSRLVLSLATFYNDYDDIHSIEPSPVSPATLVFGSGLRARSWGAELSGAYRVTDRWRLRGGYTYFDKEMITKSGHVDVTDGAGEGNDPQNQFLLQSTLDLPHNVQFDMVARYVSALPEPHVPSYFTFDVRVAWRPRKNLEFSIVGQNLWEDRHPEFGPAATRQEIPRSVYGRISWSF